MITWEIDAEGTLTLWRDDAEIVKVFIPAKERTEMVLALLKSLKQ